MTTTLAQDIIRTDVIEKAKQATETGRRQEVFVTQDLADAMTPAQWNRMVEQANKWGVDLAIAA